MYAGRESSIEDCSELFSVFIGKQDRQAACSSIMQTVVMTPQGESQGGFEGIAPEGSVRA
jgi:hypothetical protein